MLSGLPPAGAYAIMAGALLIESNLIIGVFVPTLTVMLSAGALAATGYLSLPAVIAIAASAVVTADLISYHTGRLLGTRLRISGAARRISVSMWNRADALMNRHAGRAVFVSRFVPLLRTLTPHLAGATHTPYRTIAPFSAGAAITWAIIEAGAGYLAADSAVHILTASPIPAGTMP